MDINQLIQRISQLEQEFYRNNSSTSQVFSKDVRFNSKMIVPHYGSVPATGGVGEIIEVGGKLYICSATNTWAVVGTQT